MTNHTATVLDLAVLLSDRIAACAALAALGFAGWVLARAGRPRATLQAIPVRSRSDRSHP